MRLKRLVLRNFGLFRGEQSLELDQGREYEQRPLVIVGGANGSGKTTLLEAVRVCLHGRLALGPRVTDAAYQSYLRDRMHRFPDRGVPSAYSSVGLEFEYSHLGRQSIYYVQRGWETRGSLGVKEGIRVLRDGETLDEVDAELWPDFIRSLVPPGVAQLFFFDGEKIKRLAEEETEALALGESIKALLGLDLVERLQADLDVFSAKHSRRTAHARAAKRLGELEKELRDLGGELKKLDSEVETLKNEHDDLEGQIAELDQRLAQQGEGLSSRREELRQEEANLAAELAATEKYARELLEGAAPFLLCPRLAGRLVLQLDLERKRQDWEIGQSRATETVRTLHARLLAEADRHGMGVARAPEWLERTFQDMEKEIAELPRQLRDVPVLHGLSDNERRAITSGIQVSASDSGRRLSLSAKKIIALEGELRACRTRINRMPDASDFGPFAAQMVSLQERLAKASIELTILGERRGTLQREIGVREREQSRLTEAEIASERASQRLVLAAQAREASKEYLKRLTLAKTSELERQALESFEKLSRKSDFISAIRINPETFEVSLYDVRGESIPKSSLSAGEKQIYAVSLLWGLARVSGRPLPMIVDTPLGRLDSHHRANLIQHYFPRASHQVVLLSTDTEINRTHYDELSPYTSRSYRLVDREGWTSAEEGYFWDDSDARLNS